MTSNEMNRQVGGELDHIPKYPKNPKEPKVPQSELRMIYAMRRKVSHGKNAQGSKSAGDVLRESIASVRERHPNAEFEYDREFFEGAGRV
jgi:hypothetical protein